MVINYMKEHKTYNIFLFLSTLTRNLVEVFSLVLLYKKGYTINNLIFFLFILYTTGILVNYLSLKVYYKPVLIASSLLYGLCFIYLSNLNQGLIPLSILAILQAFAIYSYHAIRHFLALTMIKNESRNTSNIILLNYLSIIASSIIGIYLLDRLSLSIISIIIFILSFISIIPILKQPKINLPKRKKESRVIIPRNKIIFNILEQSKVLFLELQSLFLYIYIDNSIYYVGIFNIITNIASLIVIYFISKKNKVKYFKYTSLILGLIFTLKLNIKSGIILLLLAFLEGIFVKLYENTSLSNLYNYNSNYIPDYLIIEEFIFFGTKSILMLIFLILKLNLYTIMYINIVGVILSGLFMKKELLTFKNS